MPSPPSGPQPEQCSRNRLKSVQLLNSSQCCRNSWRADLFSSCQTQVGVSREKSWGSTKWEADLSREDTAELPPFSISIGSTIPRGNSLVSYTVLREIDPATESKAWEHRAQGLRKQNNPYHRAAVTSKTHPHLQYQFWSAVHPHWVGISFTGAKSTKEDVWGQADTILKVASTALVGLAENYTHTHHQQSERKSTRDNR